MYMYKIKYMRGGKPNNLATTMSNIRFKFTIILVIMTILMIIPISTHAKDEDKTNQNIKLGDINMDSKIDSSDLLLLLRHVYASENGKKQEWILTGNKFLAGDITKNKKIDSSDTIAILRHIAAIGNKEIGNKHKDWIIKEEESITLNKTSIELKIGESEKLEVTSSENEKITWSSSNEKVAIVDSEGKVTAKGEGEATITARTERGKEVQCKVTVKVIEILATNIKLNKNTIELEVGKSEKLQVTIEPENVTNKTVSWSSSNETVATVDNEGKVTARGEGEATIVAKTSNGKEAKCTIKVKPVEIYATSIALNKNSLEIEKDKEEILIATIEPENVTNKTVIWSSSNEQVATVDQNGKVTAKNDGTAVIIAKTSNGKEIKCEITVTSQLYAMIKDESGNGYDKTITVGTRKYKIYNQGEFGRSDISSAGCSITSEAIVLSGYGKSQTPLTIANDVEYFPRSIDDIAYDLTNYGVKSTAYTSSNRDKTIKDIDNNLKQGKPVVILVRGNIDTRYTGGAHYMTLLGYSKNGKPVIGDPKYGTAWGEESPDGGTQDSLETLVDDYIYTGSQHEEGYVLID